MNDYFTIKITGLYEPVNSLSHLIAAGLFFIVMIYFIYLAKKNNMRIVPIVIFALCHIFLFTMSGWYHLVDIESASKLVLQKFDYAAIWLMIAGTFTPIHIILFRGFWGWGIVLFIWFTAITGLVLKTIFFSSIPNWATTSLYLGLGWAGLMTLWKTYQLYGARIAKWILFGGIAYTVGSVFELCGWPVVIYGVIGSHEVFHIFVVIGASLHWFFIYLIITNKEIPQAFLKS